MMKQEFEKIAGYEVSEDDYKNIIEPMYMATNLDKLDFVNVLDKKRFAVKKGKTAEQKALEEELNDEIASLRNDIKWYEQRLAMIQNYNDAEFTTEIHRIRTEIHILKRRIKELKWVLA